jgi:hypothetical protein
LLPASTHSCYTRETPDLCIPNRTMTMLLALFYLLWASFFEQRFYGGSKWWSGVHEPRLQRRVSVTWIIGNMMLSCAGKEVLSDAMVASTTCLERAMRVFTMKLERRLMAATTS